MLQDSSGWSKCILLLRGKVGENQVLVLLWWELLPQLSPTLLMGKTASFSICHLPLRPHSLLFAREGFHPGRNGKQKIPKRYHLQDRAPTSSVGAGQRGCGGRCCIHCMHGHPGDVRT